MFITIGPSDPMGLRLRNTIRQLLILLTAALVAEGCTTVSDDGTGESVSAFTFGTEALVISDDRIPTLKREAAQGAGEAAFRLARFYEAIEWDEEQAFEWYVVSAENGHIIGMHNLAMMYRRKQGAFSQARARFWFNRVIELGSKKDAEMARDMLIEMEVSTSGDGAPGLENPNHAQLLAAIVSHVSNSYGWPRQVYRIEYKHRVGHIYTYWIIHEDDSKRIHVGGGKSRSLEIDTRTLKVVRELWFQ